MGTKVRAKVLQALLFACPHCRADRQGALVSLRRWFTLFFLPVIPLGELGRAVRCDTCRNSFDPAVLELPTGAGVAQVRSDAVRVLAALLVGAGDRTALALRASAVRTIGSLVAGYDDATLTTDLEVLDPAQAPQYVAPLADGLDLGSKERFLAELTTVAGAAGPPTPAQRQLLEQIGAALGLTPAHVAGVIATSAPGGAR
ncbi:MAG: hypothetical protein KDB04_01930 [Acidimicrobiales bacterium]|nr:hypothetical protein [Acidimicrobiales bacterium]HRW37723.1 hypothetical protein [Aquihabitans sp.]